MTPTALAVVALAVVGTAFFVVGAVGLLRLPDVYARAHATSKSDTLGVLLSLSAVALSFGVDRTTLKVGFLALFVLVTNPMASHAITRAAYRRGLTPWTQGTEETDR